MMKTEIGAVLSFNEAGYNQAVNTWNSQLFPKLMLVIQEFEKLGIGSFDQNDLNRVLNNNLEGIRTDFNKSVQVETKKLGNTITALAIDQERVQEIFESFEYSVNSFQQTMSSVKSLVFGAPDINFDDVKIQKGKPVLDTDFIKDRFTVKIENEKQAEFYSLLTDLKVSYDKVKSFMKVNGMGNLLVVDSDLRTSMACEDQETGELFIDPISIRQL